MYSKRERELRGIAFEIKTIGYYEVAEDIVVYATPDGFRVLGAHFKTLAQAVDAADRAHNAVKHSAFKIKAADAGKATVKGGGKIVGGIGRLGAKALGLGFRIGGNIIKTAGEAIQNGMKKEEK